MNKKTKFALKTAFWSLAAAAVYYPVSDLVTMCLYRHKDQDIEEYVEENIEHIIKKQEEKIGMSYPAERPKIEHTFPENYIFPGIVGLYNDGKDTMYLPSGLLTQPEWNFGDFITTVGTFNKTADAKRVLDHELAHFYCDKVREKALGKNYHFLRSYMFTPEEIIANKIIDEGIAKYIENNMNGEDKKPFPFEKWPSAVEHFSGDVIYQGGYAIVKPIIDKHSEKGIQFLLFNPPTPKELFAPKEYQERILTDIAKLDNLFLPLRVQ